MAVALHGNLKDFGIAEVFQLIGQQRKTGVLEIAGQRVKMRLAFNEGSVVWASPMGSSEYEALGDMLVRCGFMTRERVAELLRASSMSARPLAAVVAENGDLSSQEVDEVVDLLTREVIFEVLRWTAGSFHFSAKTVEHDRPPERLLGAEQILMDGLRMVDEWRTFAQQVPSDEIVFRRSGTFEVHRQTAKREAKARLPQAERVFQLVDGRLNARRIIDLSRLGTFDATRALATLREEGLLEAIDARSARSLAAPRLGIGSLFGQLRWALAASLPVALLAGMAWTALQGAAPAPAGGAHLEHRSFERAVQRFETRRVRNALEAHRYLWREWPESLTGVDRTGLLGDRPLAGTQDGTYYYARRGDGIVVLAPER